MTAVRTDCCAHAVLLCVLTVLTVLTVLCVLCVLTVLCALTVLTVLCRFKQSSLEKVANTLIIVVFLFELLLCIFAALSAGIWCCCSHRDRHRSILPLLAGTRRMWVRESTRLGTSRMSSRLRGLLRRLFCPSSSWCRI